MGSRGKSDISSIRSSKGRIRASSWRMPYPWMAVAAALSIHHIDCHYRNHNSIRVVTGGNQFCAEDHAHIGAPVVFNCRGEPSDSLEPELLPKMGRRAVGATLLRRVTSLNMSIGVMLVDDIERQHPVTCHAVFHDESTTKELPGLALPLNPDSVPYTLTSSSRTSRENEPDKSRRVRRIRPFGNHR